MNINASWQVDGGRVPVGGLVRQESKYDQLCAIRE